MNMNKLNFIGGIVGGLIGLIAGIGMPLIMRYSPQNMVYFVMGLMGLVILTMFFLMIVMLLAKETIRKLTAPIFLVIIGIVAFFALFLYQQIAPANAPYLDQVKNLNLWYYFQNMPFVMPIAMLIVMLPIIIWSMRFMFGTFFTREDILKDGISSQAKIMSITDYGLSVNNQPVFKITLEVNSPSQGTYQVTKDFFVPQMDLANMKVGDMVKVKIDPNNPKNVAFDTWTGNI
ncbi:MAG: hypothetical protein NTX82_02945 [Candidatus Parcubacteria bacterium]|nr:hypothetical protein [Candidatus Parcubacteria bacterium]